MYIREDLNILIMFGFFIVFEVNVMGDIMVNGGYLCNCFDIIVLMVCLLILLGNIYCLIKV